MAERKRKRAEDLFELDAFRRRLPHVSQSALAAILEEE